MAGMIPGQRLSGKDSEKQPKKAIKKIKETARETIFSQNIRC
jgi:hypothetical protein